MDHNRKYRGLPHQSSLIMFGSTFCLDNELDILIPFLLIGRMQISSNFLLCYVSTENAKIAVGSVFCQQGHCSACIISSDWLSAKLPAILFAMFVFVSYKTHLNSGTRLISVFFRRRGSPAPQNRTFRHCMKNAIGGAP